MAEPFKVYRVPDDAPIKWEAMGTKPKSWFERDGEMWLFKATRPGEGEHWAEVVAAGLAELLRLPHARYELASWRNQAGVVNAGVVTPTFVPKAFDLVHGNELLHERDPSYPPEGARHVRTQEHTIEAVRAVIGAEGVGLPIGWEAHQGIESPADVFGGYLLLDAWIGKPTATTRTGHLWLTPPRPGATWRPPTTTPHHWVLTSGMKNGCAGFSPAIPPSAWRAMSSGPPPGPRSTCRRGILDRCQCSRHSALGQRAATVAAGLNALPPLEMRRLKSFSTRSPSQRCPDPPRRSLRRY